MFNWLRRRRLSAEARKKLSIIGARSQEALIETHVANVLSLYRALADEVDEDRALELYTEMIPLSESMDAAVSNRFLARLESPAPRGQRPPRIRRLESGLAKQERR